MRERSGFTLVELLVTLAVVGVLLAFVYQIFIAQQRSFSIQEEVADAQQNARVAMEELTRALASLGAGVAGDEGQVRLLVAHPYQLTFNADRSTAHDAMAPGSAVPGAEPADRYQVIPGTYAAPPTAPARPAETYRYALVPDGAHYALIWEVNAGPDQPVAQLLANPALDEPLFRYYGDFDGDGSFETLDRVDTATSPRVAAGESLDAVIRRIELHVVTRTAHADPRYPEHGGYRLTRLTSAVSPRNLWDCPVVSLVPATVPDQDPATPGHQLHRSAGLLGSTLGIGFRVTRGGGPEAGRRVEFSLAGPSTATVTGAGTTDADGRVDATISWPAACGAFPTGVHTLTARTAEPPTLSTPFGLCAPHTTAVDLEVITGLPRSVSFDGVAVMPGAPLTADAAHTLDVPGCGGTVGITYEVLDYCAERVRPQDALAHPVDLDVYAGLHAVTGFGELDPNPITAEAGTLLYQAYKGGPYSAYPMVSRSDIAPHPYQVALRPTGLPGQIDVRIHPQPHRLVSLMGLIPAGRFSDCPEPALGVADAFSTEDLCGNPLTTLEGNPFGDYYVLAKLQPNASPAPPLGTLSSAGNPSLLANEVAIRRDDGTGRVSAGTLGAWVTGGNFELRYTPPVCGLGADSFRPSITLTPSWDPGAAPPPLEIALASCTSCAVQVLDSLGAVVTSLNRECRAEYTVEVTHCDPAGTTVELVIESVSGGGSPSFRADAAQNAVLLPFSPGVPPGGPQTARARLYLHDAPTGSEFRIRAHLPDAASAGLLGSASCWGELITVDTSCEEILISAVPDNTGVVPWRAPAEDTPLCAAEGSEVFFRVKDCNQNASDFARDEIRGGGGASRGLLVQVIDAGGVIFDQEAPDLFEVNVHGTSATDSPYFQGGLMVTRNPGDPSFSGKLRVPPDRVVRLLAQYTDPGDLGDDRCIAQAVLIPPIPACLTLPIQSWADWEGDLRLHGGDAGIAGDLLLPAAPILIEKSPGAPLAPAPYGADPQDRFLNVYVGGTIFADGAPLPPAGETDQPFSPSGGGSFLSDSHPNYFQRVPAVAGLLGRLDYNRLRLLAKARKVYWEAVPRPGGWLVSNTAKPLLGPIGFDEATSLGGMGGHDGTFVFVDAPAALQGSALVDGASLADLPEFVVSGDYYTEGLLYVAGSVTFDAATGPRRIPVEVASSKDERYDEDAGGFSREELPIDFAPSAAPLPVGDLDVTLRGALYCDGELRLPGGPRVYGALAAERGVREAGAAELWYDPRWRGSRATLCHECCPLRVEPVSPEVDPWATLALTPLFAQGAVTWESLAPAVAAVHPATGEVAAAGLGTAVIRATDAAGCVAETEVRVRCPLTLEALPGNDLWVGDRATVMSSGALPPVAWSSDAPPVLAIVLDLGPSVEVEAVSPGAARLEILDDAGCRSGIDFTVNCPAGRRLTAAGPDPAGIVTLSVLDPAGRDESGAYLFFADEAPLTGRDFSPPAGSTSFNARALLGSGSCPVGPTTFTVAP